MGTISRVSSSAAASNTLTPGTHAQYDLLLAFAFRDASNTAPTVPSTTNPWKPIYVLGTGGVSMIAAYKIATNGSQDFGTWTSATEVGLLVYRSSTDILIPNFRAMGGANSTTWTFPALNPGLATGGTFWIGGVLGIQDGSGGNLASADTPPSGMTKVISADNGSSKLVLHDTNGNATAWPATAITGAQISRYVACTVEILESGLAIPAGGSSVNGPPIGGRLVMAL